MPHIGDHDTSGVHLFRSKAEDVQAMACDLGYKGDIRFSRLAVTPEQIASPGLLTAPAKATDRRGFEGETVQAEANAPGVLVSIVSDAIEARLDRAAYDGVLDREEAVRERLAERLAPLLDAEDRDE